MPPERILRVLIIEDSEDDAYLLIKDLERGGFTVSSERVETAQGVEAALKCEDWDIVFSDFTMPGFSGSEALALINESGLDIPFIFVSGTMGEDIAVEAMRSGAADYLMKDNLKRLLPAVERELREKIVRRKRRDAEKRIYYMARFDILTGLPNRAQFLGRLEQTLSDARRNKNMVAVGFLDLNRFKEVNDSLGHDAGDAMLKLVSQRLLSHLRDSDAVARLNGDEFSFVLSNLATASIAPNMARKLLNAFHAPFIVGGRELRISASLGLALFPLHGNSSDELLRNADMAMYRAKQTGENRFEFYTVGLAREKHARLTIENALRQACAQGNFLLHYQPQIDAVTGAIVGVEALLRWADPKFAHIGPARFIPLAEEIGLIALLDEWALRSACADARAWRDLGVPPLRVAVNVSANHVGQKLFPKIVTGVLEDFGLAPDWLELEITESVLMHNPDAQLTTLQGFRDSGIRISLDDFGTGFSSLSYLKRLPLDSIKIDKSFVRDILVDAGDAAITKSIIALAKYLNIRVVAEGVETRAQFDFLRREGCHVIQGYFLRRPTPGRKILKMLKPDSDSVILRHTGRSVAESPPSKLT